MRVTVVCGPRGAGKTAYLQQMAEGRENIRGVVSVRAVRDGVDVGYDAVNLENGRGAPLLRLGGGTVGRYREVPGAFALTCGWIDLALETRANTLVLDEVGRLEIGGGGFAPALRKMLRSGAPSVYLGVRGEHVDLVARAFDLGEYRRIEVSGVRGLV